MSVYSIGHHQERHAHVPDAHAQVSRHQSVAQFMQRLGDRQRAGKAQRPFPRNRFKERVAERVPLPHGQEQAQQCQRPYRPCRCRPQQPAQIGVQTLQQIHGAHQRDPKEQVMVQPPVGCQPFAAGRGGGHGLAAAGMRAQQLVVMQKAGKLQDLRAVGLQRRLLADVFQHVGRQQMPARQTFEFQPADPEMPVAYRIFNNPRRAAIRIRSTRE
ncbi:hypothetical protein [Achromobacter sp. AGC39]